MRDRLPGDAFPQRPVPGQPGLLRCRRPGVWLAVLLGRARRLPEPRMPGEEALAHRSGRSTALVLVRRYGARAILAAAGRLDRPRPPSSAAVRHCEQLADPPGRPGMSACSGMAYALLGQAAGGLPLHRARAYDRRRRRGAILQRRCCIWPGRGASGDGRSARKRGLPGRGGACAPSSARSARHEAWALRLLGEIAAHAATPPAAADAERRRTYRQALALADELGMRPLVGPLPPRPRHALPAAGAATKARERADDRGRRCTARWR